MKSNFVLFFILSITSALKADNNLSIYGSFSSNLGQLNYRYQNLGLNFALDSSNKKYLNMELLFAKKTENYTYFKANDYNFLFKRTGIGGGFGYNFKITPRLYIKTELNIYLTKYSAKLNTEDDFLKEILMPQFNKQAFSTTFAAQLAYAFTQRSSVFFKYHGNLQKNNVIHGSLLGLGYSLTLNY